MNRANVLMRFRIYVEQTTIYTTTTTKTTQTHSLSQIHRQIVIQLRQVTIEKPNIEQEVFFQQKKL